MNPEAEDCVQLLREIVEGLNLVKNKAEEKKGVPETVNRILIESIAQVIESAEAVLKNFDEKEKYL